MLDFRKCQNLYARDPVFKQVVDSLMVLIEKNKISPHEAREAGNYAATMFQMLHVDPILRVRDDAEGDE